MPRILTLLAESHPEDNELKSEAQFQRFVASFSDHPTQPRTPRAASDRGRYPEDATEEEPSREDYSSDDEGEPDEVAPFSFSHSSEPINIAKPLTPAHSVYGDDMGLSESPGNMALDIDMVCDYSMLNVYYAYLLHEAILRVWLTETHFMAIYAPTNIVIMCSTKQQTET